MAEDLSEFLYETLLRAYGSSTIEFRAIMGRQ